MTLDDRKYLLFCLKTSIPEMCAGNKKALEAFS